MASKIICTTDVTKGANEWYGILTVSNIQYEDGSPVTIKEFLGVKFNYPSPNTPDERVPVLIFKPDPWQSTSVTVIANKETPSGEMEATVKIIFPNKYTFDKSLDVLNWGVDGDLTKNTDVFTESFELYADSIPSE